MSYPDPFGGEERRGANGKRLSRAAQIQLDRAANAAEIRERFDRSKVDPYDEAHGLDRDDFQPESEDN